MVNASKTLPFLDGRGRNVMAVEKAVAKWDNPVHEAVALLKWLADRKHGTVQYILADCYANGLGTACRKQGFEHVYLLFVLAAKHGHLYAAYRTGTSCENSWGCRRKLAKALTFLKKAAAASHPGALYKPGVAELDGELGLHRHPKDGVQYLKCSAEHATQEFPHVLHKLALLHKRGIKNMVFADTSMWPRLGTRRARTSSASATSTRRWAACGTPRS
jgi:TPR repeat protein